MQGKKGETIVGKWLYKATKGLVVLFYRLMCWILPVKKNRIVFDSSLGKSYAGNPKHIYEYLVANGYDTKWDCIWFFEKEKYSIPGMSRQVRYGRMRYLYYMVTAKVWVFDTRQPEWLVRRKGTYYIQTWHGTPLKKLALDMEDVFMVGESDIETYKKHFMKNVETWDYLISQNPFSTETFRRAFDFKKEMLEIGYPRNDILFRENTPEAVRRYRKKLGLPLDKKVILYAPTWRDDEFSEDNKYEFRPQISFETLQKELSGDYIMIVKYHYLIMDAVDWSPYQGFIYHFDQSRDIAELFLVSDILITDYSSVMFDFSILRRPIFFFAYDFYKYKNELRGFYFSYRKEMPGPISSTTEQLVEDIRNYDASIYEERYQKFIEKYNSVDDGNASSHVLDLIHSLLPERQPNVYYDME
ncbi:MAG: CDP-glycerol glycerophosphotransferase family protein [Lachnospiraceae bacterium]|nr:CDP-glycerol glycerophosphotransferase family protein [Lachnospiraceae bacterium]